MKNESSDQEFQPPDWVVNEKVEFSFGKPSKSRKIWLTVTLLIIFPICIFLGWLEFGRAREGNWRAWVYAFEWPLFAAMGLYLWRKLMRGDTWKISKGG